MKDAVLSRRYAEAFADVLERDGELERAVGELSVLAGALLESRAFRNLVNTGQRSRHQKRALLRGMGEELGLLPQTLRLLDYLAQKRRTALLPQLARSLAEEADRRLGVQRALVTSALPLTDEQRRRIIEKLEAVCRARVRLEEGVDESLIAGYQVRLDGQVYDGTLRGKLERIRERIAHG